MDNLSPRLARIQEYVESGSVVADIGTDHAYLPINLINQGTCPRVIAGDINEGPYETAKETIQKNHLEKQINLRLGNGLKILQHGEADTIVIAGMGGATIIDILVDSPEILKNVRKLILQPMIATGQLRLWLVNNGWQITAESLVKEERRIYEIIVAEKGEQKVQEPLAIFFWPRLLEEKPPLLLAHLKRLLKADEEIYRGLSKSSRADAILKSIEVKERIDFLEKVTKCL